MTKLPVIADEHLEALATELTNVTRTILSEDISEEQRKALHVWITTMAGMLSTIFDWLPEGEADSILRACGTWFDVGILFGRSPELLVNILNKIKPEITELDIPDWVLKNFKQ